MAHGGESQGVDLIVLRLGKGLHGGEQESKKNNGFHGYKYTERFDFPDFLKVYSVIVG